MKYIKNDLPETLERLEIEIFSDMHIGSKKCDYKLIQERVKRVQENENVYAIILGDVINNSTKDSVGDVYEETLTPMQQVNVASRTFEPIKDKILGITSGNHERRSYRKEGVDILYFMANEFGLAEKYDYCACLLFIRFGRMVHRSSNYCSKRKVCYTLYMTHGDGQGGRTVGGKANGLHRRGQIIDSDIIVTGHTHMPLTFKDKSFVVDTRNSSAYEHEQIFVNASATLDYEEYAELYGMKPSSKASPKILLNGKRKDIRVVL